MIIATDSPYPVKPALGEPCNGCGYCCHEIVCEVGLIVNPGDQAPCSLMVFDENRVWCGAVLMEKTSGLPRLAAEALGIGRGCDSDPH